ncbi:MAG: hypothetical protein AAF944_22045 [Bacteroidota bacterium]
MSVSDKKYLQSAYEYFHKLNITFYLLIAVPLVGFCYAYLHYEAKGGLLPTVQFSWIHITFILGTVLCVAYALYWYRQALQQLDTDWPFQKKLRFFYQRSRSLHTILMVSNGLAALGLYLTGEQLFAGVYAIVLVVFSLYRPTYRRVVRDLRLSKAEEEKLVRAEPYSENNQEKEESQ